MKSIKKITFKVSIILVSLIFNLTTNSYANNSVINSQKVDFNTYITKARAFIDKKEYDKALLNYKKALELEPLNKNLFLEIVSVTKNYIIEAKKQGNLTEVKKKIQEYFKQNQKLFFIYEKDLGLLSLIKAEQNFRNKNEEKSVSLLQMIKDTSPFKEDANALLCSCYLKISENYEKKGDKFKHVESLEFAKESCSKLTKIPHEIQERIDDMLTVAYMILSFELIHQNKDKEALITLKKSLDISPNDSDALIIYGKLLFDMGEYEKGFSFVQKGILYANEENIKFGYFNLAKMYSVQNNKEEALKYLKKTIELDSAFKKNLKDSKEFTNISKEDYFIEIAK